MKGVGGSLLSLWSGIERSLQAALSTKLFGDVATPVHGISRPLAAWSDRLLTESWGRPRQAEPCRRLTLLLREALTVRNLVGRGPVGYVAQDSQGSHEAYLRARDEPLTPLGQPSST